MAEESKQKFDPDATVAQPAAGANAGVDPDATVALPMAALDPDATVSGPIVAIDPEATFTGPNAKKAPDVDATDRRPAFDPDATVNPAERASLDPDATVRVPSPGRVRNNPFAPKSSPETIQANLAALGGLNPLIALANPILGAVPQIRRTLKHPDPAGLRANLRDQIESLQTSASFAEVSDASVQSAVYGLCALLDESAAATPWGGTWIENGLLKEVCGESGGGDGFFMRLDQITAARDPVDADNARPKAVAWRCTTFAATSTRSSPGDGRAPTSSRNTGAAPPRKPPRRPHCRWRPKCRRGYPRWRRPAQARKPHCRRSGSPSCPACRGARYGARSGASSAC